MITTILLVDDHHGFRQFLRQLLDKETDMKVSVRHTTAALLSG